jgi:hypothetical protein
VFALACRAPTPSQPQPTQPAQLTQSANASTVATAGDGAQRFAELGTCTLASGERIEDCRIGFRGHVCDATLFATEVRAFLE